MSTSTITGQDHAAIILDFMLICGRLKTTKRTGWVNNKVSLPESISDHMHRMGLLSLAFAGFHSETNIDFNKVGNSEFYSIFLKDFCSVLR
jgi:5'-deoxynucleotidase YfbR-like HD superfamily hydrolase